MLRYAITDGHSRFGPGKAAPERLAMRCAELAVGGVEFILLREKQLAAGELTALSRSVVAAVRRTGAATRVLVAGRADVALAAGADGVHLASGPGRLRVEEVRRVFAEAFVSVSCHSEEEVTRAREESASAALFAPVFGKQVEGIEVAAGVGLEALRGACAAAREMPVFALGGVSEGNSAECVGAGAGGVAGIRMFFPPGWTDRIEGA